MSKISPATDPVLERVRALVAPLCAAHGVDLVSLVWAGRTLRITIERRNAGEREDPAATSGWGVTLEDCAELSRDASRAFDEQGEDFIPGSYSLEVSSPGLERDLYGEADFRRFIGFPARVKLSKPAPDGQRLLRGSIESLTTSPTGSVELGMRVDKKLVVVPFDAVTEANLVYELPASPSVRKGASSAERAGRGAARPKKERRRASQKGA
jgi:ribosome maturation factor RimP